MVRSLFALLLLFIAAYSHAQAPTIQWQRSLSGSAYDIGRIATHTTDGGYIVTGTTGSADGNVTGSNGNNDFWIAKLNDTGALQWQRALGGSGSDESLIIRQTADGGYITIGQTRSNDSDIIFTHGLADIWVVKLNDTGAILWQKTYGGSSLDYGYSIMATPSGGYIIAASTYSTDGDITANHGNYDAWILKINDTGAIQWQRSYGGSNEEIATTITTTTDGGYIFAGQTQSYNGDVSGNHGMFDYWVVKLNDTGGITWQKTLGGSGADNQPWTIYQTPEGGYITAGFSQSTDGDVTGNHGGKDYWVVKLSSAGALEWQRSYGGSGDDWGRGMAPVIGGGYVLCGNSNSTDGDVTGNHGDYDFWILKIDDTGAIMWKQSYGGTGADNPFSLGQITDGGYIVAGQSSSNNGDVSGNHGNYDYWIVKLTCGFNAGVISGDTIVCTGTAVTLTDTTSGITWSLSNGHATISGSTVTGISPGRDTVAATRTNYCGTAISTFAFTVSDCPVTGINTTAMSGIALFPNPTTGNVLISGIAETTARVYNYMGQLLFTGNSSSGIDLSAYPDGLYLITIADNMGKLLKQETIMKTR